jgi:hypothetical protein
MKFFVYFWRETDATDTDSLVEASADKGIIAFDTAKEAISYISKISQEYGYYIVKGDYYQASGRC